MNEWIQTFKEAERSLVYQAPTQSLIHKKRSPLNHSLEPKRGALLEMLISCKLYKGR